MLDVMRSGRLVQGPRTAAFEDRLAQACGRRHAVAVSSGTTALLAAMRTLGVGPGQIVVVPALTFPAPASVAAWLGASVRLCDVEPLTMNLSPRTLLPCLDGNVRLVVAVDQFGMPAPCDDIEALLAARGIPLLVDAACSVGSSWRGRPCGSFGLMSTTSFHPRKIFTTGEGGAILCDDDDLAQTLRRERNHGLESGGFVEPGLNLRLGEIPAAIGLAQMERLAQIVELRRGLAQRYLANLPLDFQQEPQGALCNRQTLAARLPMSVERAAFIEDMAAHGVEVGLLSYCCTDLASLSSHLVPGQADTPEARDIASRGIALPLYPQMTAEELDTVVGLVHDRLKSR